MRLLHIHVYLCISVLYIHPCLCIDYIYAHLLAESQQNTHRQSLQNEWPFSISFIFRAFLQFNTTHNLMLHQRFYPERCVIWVLCSITEFLVLFLINPPHTHTHTNTPTPTPTHTLVFIQNMESLHPPVILSMCLILSRQYLLSCWTIFEGGGIFVSIQVKAWHDCYTSECLWTEYIKFLLLSFQEDNWGMFMQVLWKCAW